MLFSTADLLHVGVEAGKREEGDSEQIKKKKKKAQYQTRILFECASSHGGLFLYVAPTNESINHQQSSVIEIMAERFGPLYISG